MDAIALFTYSSQSAFLDLWRGSKDTYVNSLAVLDFEVSDSEKNCELAIPVLTISARRPIMLRPRGLLFQDK